MTPERACNINSAVAAGFTWTRASQIFGQFQDPLHTYGLNFKLAEEAESFAQYVHPDFLFPVVSLFFHCGSDVRCATLIPTLTLTLTLSGFLIYISKQKKGMRGCRWRR